MRDMRLVLLMSILITIIGLTLAIVVITNTTRQLRTQALEGTQRFECTTALKGCLTRQDKPSACQDEYDQCLEREPVR